MKLRTPPAQPKSSGKKYARTLSIASLQFGSRETAFTISDAVLLERAILISFIQKSFRANDYNHPAAVSDYPFENARLRVSVALHCYGLVVSNNITESVSRRIRIACPFRCLLRLYGILSIIGCPARDVPVQQPVDGTTPSVTPEQPTADFTGKVMKVIQCKLKHKKKTCTKRCRLW
jgi:hypothetical protein